MGRTPGREFMRVELADEDGAGLAEASGHGGILLGHVIQQQLGIGGRR